MEWNPAYKAKLCEGEKCDDLESHFDMNSRIFLAIKLWSWMAGLIMDQIFETCNENLDMEFWHA